MSKITVIYNPEERSQRETPLYTPFAAQNSYALKLFSGIAGECVELARRHLIQNNGVTFGEVDSAFEIWDQTQFQCLTGRNSFTPSRLENGHSEFPPSIGDLLVYPSKKNSRCWKHGHVAVVAAIDAEGTLTILEQNVSEFANGDRAIGNRKVKIAQTSSRFEVMDTLCPPIGWISLSGKIH
jgi:hypothetical protein